MAKRRGRTSTREAPTKTPEKPEPEPEERASFLPGDADIEAQLTPDLQQRHADIETPTNGSIPEISLRIYEKEAGRFWASIIAGPLEPSEWPIASLDPKVSPERRASVVLGAIAQAASSGAQHGLIQEQRRMDEEAAAKERFAKRA